MIWVTTKKESIEWGKHLETEKEEKTVRKFKAGMPKS